MAGAPPLAAVASIIGPSTRVTRRVDIYEEDATTPFVLDAPVLDGSVSVDGTRDERRTLDISLENIDGALDNYPGGFWYDKVLKVFRGLTWDGLTPSYVRWPAVGTNYLQTAASPAHTIAGNVLSIRTYLKKADYTSGQHATIAAKYNTVGNQRSWQFEFHDTNRLLVTLSTDGTNALDLFINVPASLVDGTAEWVGVDIQINNGAGGKTATFLTSVDGVVWDEEGSASSATLGTAPLHNSTAPITIGALANNTNHMRNADMYYVGVFDGARSIVDLDFTGLAFGAGGMADNNGIAFSFNDGVSRVEGGLYQEQSWETQVGEFLVDRIDTQNFPHVTKVSGRDYTKKLMEAQFIYATTFAQGQTVESVIQTIAVNGGINKYLLPFTGEVLGRDFTFEAQASRWDAIKQIAQAYGYDVYFDQQGFLVMQEFQDPVTSPIIYTFETGEFGNLAAFGKSVSDTRIYNQIVVRGEATDILPVTAVAENHEPSSPTSIENLDRTKTYNYTSAFITTQAQANDVAAKFLAVHALEAFEVSLTSVVIPWLEALNIVEFLDPDPNPGDPDRFLLSSFNIPMKLGAMSAVAKRVTVVG